MLNSVQIKSNYETFKSLVKESFKEESRKSNIESIIDVWEERFMMAPASPKDWHNNAFPGGYLDHILRVNTIANQLYNIYKSNNSPIDFTESELNFVSLFCQLGKLGDVDNEYFQKNDSDWHVKNMGMIYKFNPNIPAMKIYDRTLYLLQKANISITQNEYLAIRNQEGLFDDSNKFYFYSGQKETRFRTILPLILHQAIQTAQEIEFQMWCSNSENKPYKPNNASKADKITRKAKSMDKANNPKFNAETKNLIKNLFNEE